jgi:hypothetical protein
VARLDVNPTAVLPGSTFASDGAALTLTLGVAEGRWYAVGEESAASASELLAALWLCGGGGG